MFLHETYIYVDNRFYRRDLFILYDFAFLKGSLHDAIATAIYSQQLMDCMET